MPRPMRRVTSTTFKHTISVEEVVALVRSDPGHSDYYYASKLAPVPNWTEPGMEAVKKALRMGDIRKGRKGNTHPIYPV